MNFLEILQNQTYTTVFPNGLTVMWRALSIAEYKKVNDLIASGIFTIEQIRSMVAKEFSTLKDLSNLKAGVLSTIGGLILWQSGDPNQHTLVPEISQARETCQANGIYSYFIEVITLAFPSLSPLALEKLNKQELIKLFALSESKLQKINSNYKPLDLAGISFNQEVPEKDVNELISSLDRR